MNRVRRGLILLLVAAVVAGYPGFVRTPPGPRSMRAFDADRMAQLELDMWQAYYRHENVRLFRGLVTMLHEQYRYSWSKAVTAAFYLARAARTFGDARSRSAR